MGILHRLRRHPLPLEGFLTAREYKTVRRAPVMTPGVATLMGIPTRYSDNTGFLHSVREVFADEVYRFRAKRDAPYIVDAGANIGLSVRYFKNSYPNATVLAFEPDPQIFAMLEENVGHVPGVELRRTAAWIEDTTLTFYIEGSLAGSSEMDFLGKGRKVRVPAQRLKHELNRPVDFLKIDIEGAENSVLFDIEDELANVDHLFFEYHSVPGKPQQLGALLELVTRNGFRYSINGAHGARLPFVEKVDHGFDLQLNIFCFRD